MGDKEQPIAKKRPALGNLNNRVRFSIEAAPKSAKKSAKTHGKENTPKKKTASITPPPNGRAVFSPREAAEKVATSANAAATKRELIKKGYVKCGTTQLHYLATRWKNGDHIDEVWGRKGAKPLMEVEEVDQMAGPPNSPGRLYGGARREGGRDFGLLARCPCSGVEAPQAFLRRAAEFF